MPTSYDFTKVRLGKVASINRTTNKCAIEWYDRIGRQRTEITLTQPYSGRGWGIHVGVEIGSVVVVGEESAGHMRILAYLPHQHFFLEDVVEKFIDVTPDESPYNQVREGEISLQSKANSLVAMNELGDIVFQTADGNSVEIDREADLIFQQSVQRRIVSDAAIENVGTIRRDVRDLADRELDILFGGVTNIGLDFDLFTETVGLDPRYPEVALEGGKSSVTNQNLIPGLFDPSFPDKLEDGRGLSPNFSDMLNPAITEHRLVIQEFNDGNPGLDPDLLDDRAKRRGHLEPNTLVETIKGTVTNEIGRQLRFDYAFSQSEPVDGVQASKGHSRIWRTAENINADSWDHFFSRANTLKGLSAFKTDDPKTAPGHNLGSEWTVDSIEQGPTAVMYRRLLHTKGADNRGRKETDVSRPFRSGQENQITTALADSFPGSLWELQVDKEGLTKLNVPAATDLNGLEPYRAGRSVLANFDGDISVSVGKHKATDVQGVPRLTQPVGGTAFLNRNDADIGKYGRKDRSLTLDLEGNFETHIGADDNVNQSVIAQLDGSMALFLGKEIAATAATDDFDVPITTAAKASTRLDRSLTARMEGNLELEVGADEDASQSLIIKTTGGNALHVGKDRDDQSFQIVTTGGIDIQIQGPMQTNSYALHIDATGKLHIQCSDVIQVETPSQIFIQGTKQVTVKSEQSLKLEAATIDIGGPTNQAINIAGKVINMQSTDGGGGQIIRGGGVDILAGTTQINSPGGVNILGSVGLAGQLLGQSVPGIPVSPIARVGDLVQVGPFTGQIITGSATARIPFDGQSTTIAPA